MKTKGEKKPEKPVQVITIVGRNDNIRRPMTIRTNDGQLKTTLLLSLLKGKRVVLTKAILAILIEVLKEVKGSHQLNRQLARDLEDAEDEIEGIRGKYEGTIKDLEDELGDKDDDIADLLLELCEAHSFIAELTTGTDEESGTESK